MEHLSPVQESEVLVVPMWAYNLVLGLPLVLATVPVLDPAGIIGLRGNGLTPSKIDDFLSEPTL